MKFLNQIEQRAQFWDWIKNTKYFPESATHKTPMSMFCFILQVESITLTSMMKYGFEG